MKRNERGQFLETTGSRRYKSKSYKGKDIQLSRWIWTQQHGEIPEGYVVHHKNSDKFDNGIENLSCMSHREHNLIHSHSPWNKGLTRKDKRWKEAQDRALSVRRGNYLRKCEDTYLLKQKYTYRELEKMLGVCARQLCERVQTWKKTRKSVQSKHFHV